MGPAATRADNPARLTPLDAVLYSAGKRIRPGGSFGDEFPLRARTLRGHNIRPGVAGWPPSGPRAAHLQGLSDQSATTHHPHEGEWVGSVQLKADGLRMKVGGRSVIGGSFQNDLNVGENSGPDGRMGFTGISTSTTMTQAHANQLGIPLPASPPTLTSQQVTTLTGYATDNCGTNDAACWDEHMDDLTLDFGRPLPDPDGEPGYYWSGKMGLGGRPAPSKATADANGAPGYLAAVEEQWEPRGPATGEYSVYMSNYAGVDPDDDESRYLDYTAYGMFVFTDYTTSHIRPVISQGFHFGYDAFADANEMRTSEVTAAGGGGELIYFEGEAMGLVLHPFGDRSQVHHLTRVRGDVMLQACLGSAACTRVGSAFTPAGPKQEGANRITGLINNLEFRPANSDTWYDYAWLMPAVHLLPTDINDNGSFEGETDVFSPNRYTREGVWQSFISRGGGANWNNPADDAGGYTGPDLDGKWGGNFYGSKDDLENLEAGGWWHMYPSPNQVTTNLNIQGDLKHSGVVGSFGAKKATP